MSAIAEARMRSGDLREVRVLLATSVTIFIVHASLLVYAISRLDFVFRHPNNIAIVLVLICWASVAVLLSSWYVVIFAVHVTSVRFAEGGLALSRLLAARKSISRVRRIRKIVVPVPALGGVGYTRGALIICTHGLFYIADVFPESRLLVERLLAMSSGAYSCQS